MPNEPVANRREQEAEGRADRGAQVIVTASALLTAKWGSPFVSLVRGLETYEVEASGLSGKALPHPLTLRVTSDTEPRTVGTILERATDLIVVMSPSTPVAALVSQCDVQWFAPGTRHCATRQNVVGSITDKLTGFFY